MWLHELRYQAETCDRARRVVLVVKEREDDLRLNRFFLVSSLTLAEMRREDILEHYRARGTAEGHMGEMKDVLAPAFAIALEPWRTMAHLTNRPTRTGAAEACKPRRPASMPSLTTRFGS